LSKFQDRLEHVGTRLDECNGETVSIRRGGTTVTDKIASPVLQMAEDIIPGIAQTRVDYTEWGVDVDQWDFGAGPVVPLHGDIIIRADNGNQYQVTAMGTDNPVFRYTTSDKTRMLVNTNRITS